MSTILQRIDYPPLKSHSHPPPPRLLIHRHPMIRIICHLHDLRERPPGVLVEDIVGYGNEMTYPK